jgi:hypothetical protein
MPKEPQKPGHVFPIIGASSTDTSSIDAIRLAEATAAGKQAEAENNSALAKISQAEAEKAKALAAKAEAEKAKALAAKAEAEAKSHAALAEIERMKLERARLEAGLSHEAQPKSDHSSPDAATCETAINAASIHNAAEESERDFLLDTVADYDPQLSKALRKRVDREGLSAEQVRLILNDRNSRLSTELLQKLSILPSSERGPLGGNGDDDNGGPDPPSNLAKYQRQLKTAKNWRKVAESLKPESLRGSVRLREYLRSLNSEVHLIPINETAGAYWERESATAEAHFSDEERLELFGRTKNLQSSYDTSTKLDLRIRPVEITVRHQTLRAPGEADDCSDISYRKAYEGALPQLLATNNTLIEIQLLAARQLLPYEKISSFLGDTTTSAQISRWIQRSAKVWLPIYLQLIEELKQKSYYNFDDTSVRVISIARDVQKGIGESDIQLQKEGRWDEKIGELEGRSQDPYSLVSSVAKVIGHIASKAGTSEAKRCINKSLITGCDKMDDPRKAISLHRTHRGGCGDLLSILLDGSQHEIVLQGDHGSLNAIRKEVKSSLNVTRLGCGSHARRPFRKRLDDYTEFCAYMLLQFHHIFHAEAQLKNDRLTNESILKKRAAVRIHWEELLAVSKAVVNFEAHPAAKNDPQWVNGISMYDACEYIVNHYVELTAYLKIPWASPDNNRSERFLRAEKWLQDAALFRQSEAGRTALDIIQTIMHTCAHAEVDFRAYAASIFATPESEIEAHAEALTPYQWRMSQGTPSA